MPLTELLRMIGGNMDTTQERASNSSDPSSRPETDFCELVWENGNVMMQGQSTQGRKGPPTTSDYQALMNKPQDGRVTNGPKMNNFNTMDSVFNDFSSVVPSSEMDSGQDPEMVPWLSYSDSLHNDYISEFLPEFSGVTMNRTENNHNSSASFKRQDASKVESNPVKHSRRENSEIPKSGVSGITGGIVNNSHNVNYSRELNSSSLCAFTSLRLQKLDAGQPSTSTTSSFTNFPCFSRSAALTKANQLPVNTSKRLENDEQRCTVTGSTPTDPVPVNLVTACSRNELGTHTPSVQAPGSENVTKELLPAKRKTRKEDGMNDTQQNHALETTMSKVGTGGERNVEPIVAASSVCSGNSVGLPSNERGYGLKRKLRETESEDPSEEAEEESVGGKKAAHARASSSKRIRAAEVHNLSERRRRDRINEKMRALQELIPNCNKVDKASMLDEAIEYLKTLQLQVQMFSMGPGLYMQPMMLPPGMQPMHGAQLSHFSPMGLGMGMGMGLGVGMGMGFGSNMLDVNGGMKMPFQSPHYSVPGATTPSFHGMPGSSVQHFGHPGQGLQTPIQRPPIHQNPGAPPINIPMGANVSSVGVSNIPNSYMNRAPNQVTKDGFQPSASSHDRSQSVNASGNSLPISGPNNTS